MKTFIQFCFWTYDYYDILRVEYYCSVHNHENKKRKNYNY